MKKENELFGFVPASQIMSRIFEKMDEKGLLSEKDRNMFYQNEAILRIALFTLYGLIQDEKTELIKTDITEITGNENIKYLNNIFETLGD